MDDERPDYRPLELASIQHPHFLLKSPITRTGSIFQVAIIDLYSTKKALDTLVNELLPQCKWASPSDIPPGKKSMAQLIFYEGFLRNVDATIIILIFLDRQNSPEEGIFTYLIPTTVVERQMSQSTARHSLVVDGEMIRDYLLGSFATQLSDLLTSPEGIGEFPWRSEHWELWRGLLVEWHNKAELRVLNKPFTGTTLTSEYPYGVDTRSQGILHRIQRSHI